MSDWKTASSGQFDLARPGPRSRLRQNAADAPTGAARGLSSPPFASVRVHKPQRSSSAGARCNGTAKAPGSGPPWRHRCGGGASIRAISTCRGGHSARPAKPKRRSCWTPTTTLEELVAEMVATDVEEAKKELPHLRRQGLCCGEHGPITINVLRFSVPAAYWRPSAALWTVLATFHS